LNGGGGCKRAKIRFVVMRILYRLSEEDSTLDILATADTWCTKQHCFVLHFYSRFGACLRRFFRRRSSNIDWGRM